MKDRIRKVMEEAGLTQQEFAQYIGLSPSSISGIFNGRTNPTNVHVKALHQAFPNLSVNWLMFGEGPEYVDTTNGGSLEPVSAAESAGDGGDGLAAAAGDSIGSGEPSVDLSIGGFPGSQESTLSAGAANPAQPSLFPGMAPSARSSSRAASSASRSGASSQRSSANFPADTGFSDAPSTASTIQIPAPLPRRQIKEIRVFFDDGTYESFVPSTK